MRHPCMYATFKQLARDSPIISWLRSRPNSPLAQPLLRAAYSRRQGRSHVAHTAFSHTLKRRAC